MTRHILKFTMMAALAATASFAQAPRPARAMRALGLSDTQKSQAKTILQDARQSAAPLAQQLKQARQDMAAAVKANDTNKIQALAPALGQLQGQALAIRSTAMAKIYNILTPEQRAKFDRRQERGKQAAGRNRN